MWTWNDILQWGAMAPKDLPLSKGESLSHDDIMELWENEQYNLEPGQPNMYDALKQRAIAERESSLYEESYVDEEIGETVVPEEDYGGETVVTYDDLYPVSEASDEDFYQDTPVTDEDLGIYSEETLAPEQEDIDAYPDSTIVTDEDLKQANIEKNMALESQYRIDQENLARGSGTTTSGDEEIGETVLSIDDPNHPDYIGTTLSSDDPTYHTGESVLDDEDLTVDEYEGTSSPDSVNIYQVDPNSRNIVEKEVVLDDEYLTDDDNSPIGQRWNERKHAISGNIVHDEGLVYDKYGNVIKEEEPQSLLQRVMKQMGRNISYGGQAMLMDNPEYMTGGDETPLNFDYSGYLDWMKGLK